MRRAYDTSMTISSRVSATLLVLSFALGQAGAVELKVSREALDRTLKAQLFGAPDGRYYLKGNQKSACFVYAEDPKLRFDGERIVVELKTHARLGQKVGGACVGIALSLPAEVSLAPDGEGETVGFRDARLDRISSHEELNFVLSPFLRNEVPSGMKVNAADLLRKALEGSTVTSGFKVTLDRLKIHSVQVQGDNLIVDADGDLAVR